jgi:hypothetical protein
MDRTKSPDDKPTDVELQSKLGYPVGNIERKEALEELSRREHNRKLQENKEKQDYHKWQNHVETFLKKADRKAFWILTVAGATLLLTILFELLKK